MNKVIREQIDAFKKLRKKEAKNEAAKKSLTPVSISSTFIRFSIKEQTFFAKRMSFLIKAGVPLVESLHLIRSQTKSKGKTQVYDAVIKDVSNGQYLATSLGKHKRMFGEFAVNLIRVGEASGVLSQNLEYLADELRKKYDLQRKVVGTLVYPVFITIATLGLTAVLTAYIFPKLMPIFTSLHVDLPWTTRALIWVSDYLRNWGFLTLFGIIALFVIFLVVRNRFEGVRMFTDRVLLKLPLAGHLARAYNLTNFCRTLGLLLRSGITLSEALIITSETTKNRVYRAASAELGKRIIQGDMISKAMTDYTGVYPDILSHMIGIGEKTGNLSNTLAYLGEMYEVEVDELAKGLSSSIEPVLMVFMGILVGIIAVSVITPVYSITQHLNPHG